MDLEGIMLSKISQRKTNTVWFHLYVQSKKPKKWTNIIKQKQSYRYVERTGGCQKGDVWGEERKSEGD